MAKPPKKFEKIMKKIERLLDEAESCLNLSIQAGIGWESTVEDALFQIRGAANWHRSPKEKKK